MCPVSTDWEGGGSGRSSASSVTARSGNAARTAAAAAACAAQGACERGMRARVAVGRMNVNFRHQLILKLTFSAGNRHRSRRVAQEGLCARRGAGARPRFRGRGAGVVAWMADLERSAEGGSCWDSACASSAARARAAAAGGAARQPGWTVSASSHWRICARGVSGARARAAGRAEWEGHCVHGFCANNTFRFGPAAGRAGGRT
jgi:hypothetical protein